MKKRGPSSNLIPMWPEEMAVGPTEVWTTWMIWSTESRAASTAGTSGSNTGVACTLLTR